MDNTSARGYRVFVSNLVGCESTQQEGLRVEKYLALNGHEILASPCGAEYIVVNTCAFVEQHRKALLERMDRFKSESPDARLVIMGCVRDIAPSIMAPYPASLVCGHNDLFQLDSIFARFLRFHETPQYHWSPEYKRVLIPVGRGCVNSCSYCSIKRSIGNIKSRPVEAILEDFRKELAEGQNRFFLASDDLGSYGRDIGMDLPVLLQALDSLPEDFKVLLANIHPLWFLKYFSAIRDFLASKHASNWLYLSLQSANPQVLASMRRSYPIGEISDRLSEILAVLPKIRFYFDIMVGYPTENEEAFNDTLAFIQRFPPSQLMIAPFSREEGTAAYDLKPLDQSVLRERVRWLKKIHELAAHRSGSVSIVPWGEE